MRFVLCLLVGASLAALSSAHNSASLLQEARPLLSEATLKIKNALRHADLSQYPAGLGGQLTEELITQLHIQAEAQLIDIQDAVQAAKNAKAAVVEYLQETVYLLESVLSTGNNDTVNVLQTIPNDLATYTVMSQQKSQEAERLIADFNLAVLFRQALEATLLKFLSPEETRAVFRQLSSPDRDQTDSRAIFRSEVAVQDKSLSGMSSLVSQLISLGWSFGSNSYTAVHTMVQHFFDTTMAAGNIAADVVAAQLMNFIRPFKFVLGRVYCLVVRAIGDIIKSPVVGENC